MLRELRIRGLGIIESIDWSLGEGLNVITGETGAGKSLVIDAIEALVEGKLTEGDLRHGADEASVEGIFSLPNDEIKDILKRTLSSYGLLYDTDKLVISYDVRRQGRGTLRVNRHAINRSILREITSVMIDIHGQSDHLSLLDRRTHLDCLDAYAHQLEMREVFSTKAGELQAVEQELSIVLNNERERARHEEYLRYVVSELTKASLKVGEDEDLEKERKGLASTERLKELALSSIEALQGQEQAGQSSSVIAGLEVALRNLRVLVDIDPKLRSQFDSLEAIYIDVEEIRRDISNYQDSLEYAPERLREVESRLETISNLKKKYGDSITKVNEFLLQTERDLLASENSGIKKEELESRKRALRNELGEIAEKISRTRLSVTRTMEDGVKRELRDLGMDQVNFVISIKQTPSSDGLKLSDGRSYLHNLFGIDDVEFLISTNPGEPLLPLSRIASTGEISRIMLAIKSSLSRIDRIPVMVFDEIDIGVGGRTGEIIGKKLWKLAQKRQVICVTHLPQIAVYGDNHYKVFKETSSGRTLSELSELKGEARLKELGMMITGAKLSALSTQTARELKQSADKWKNQQKLS